MYIPNHFDIKELVDERIYTEFGKSAYKFFDDKLMITIDRLREKYGFATINNWNWGGSLDSCGFRRPSDNTGAEYSAHKRGQAVDLHFRNMEAKVIRMTMLRNQDAKPFEYINAIEMEVDWLHISTENCERIKKIWV